MNYLLALVLIVIVYVLINENESESYNFSGYKPDIRILMDPFPNLKGYESAKNDANADLMENIVLLTNKEIHKRTGISNYIIETTYMQKFSKENSIIYECRFMTMKKDGFSFGFSVVVWVIVEDAKPPKLLAIRSQPTGVQDSDQLISLSDKTMGKEFLEYKIVKEKHIPSREDFDASVGVFRNQNVEPNRSYIEVDKFNEFRELTRDVSSAGNTISKYLTKFESELES